jgi:hypothetical protein
VGAAYQVSGLPLSRPLLPSTHTSSEAAGRVELGAAVRRPLQRPLKAVWCLLSLLCSKLEAAEKAKLNLMIAYAADSLFYMFLKTQVRDWGGGARTEAVQPCPCLLTASGFPHICVTHVAGWQGASTEDHPVTEELARIKKYMGNLKALGQGAAEEQARLKVSREMAFAVVGRRLVQTSLNSYG